MSKTHNEKSWDNERVHVCVVSSESEQSGPSVVVHTGVPFGMEHIDKTLEEVQPIILHELRKVMRDLPEPESIKCQKWRFSQVRNASLPVGFHLFIFIYLFFTSDVFYELNSFVLLAAIKAAS